MARPCRLRAKAPGLAPMHLHDPRGRANAGCRIARSRRRAARSSYASTTTLWCRPEYVAEVEKFFASHSEYAAMKGRILPAEDPIAKAGPAAAYLDLPIVDHGDEVIEVRGVIGANMAFRAPHCARRAHSTSGLVLGRPDTKRKPRCRSGCGELASGLAMRREPRLSRSRPARADRDRFTRIARERGYCRTLHEAHSPIKAGFDAAIAVIRLLVVRVSNVPIDRRARAEKRLAIALGILDGLRAQRGRKRSESGNSVEQR